LTSDWRWRGGAAAVVSPLRLRRTPPPPTRRVTGGCTRRRTPWSTTSIELATRFGLAPAQIHVAPHGPLLEAAPALDPAAARRQVGLPATAPLILFTGLIEPYKGLADLVAAFGQIAREHPTAHLVIAGRPNMPVRPYRAVLAAAGLRQRAHFDLRYLPQADLAAYLCAATVVVLPIARRRRAACSWRPAASPVR
jgi:glycosyltransferase involved in cell wall biosynthesis